MFIWIIHFFFFNVSSAISLNTFYDNNFVYCYYDDSYFNKSSSLNYLLDVLNSLSGISSNNNVVYAIL